VWQVAEAFPDVPIIGTGGVRTGRDALELLLAGASLVGVGTAIVHDPSACSRVARELEEELAALGADRVADVIGQAHGGRGALGARGAHGIHDRGGGELVNGPGGPSRQTG
jgi:dihydroorotate dehydrogenase (NAD+) catalytic subunit